MSLVSFKQHFGEWLILIIFLSFLLYTAFVVKKERETFLKNLKDYLLGGFNIPTPSWWTLVESSDQYLLFKRTDTRYDWYAKFSIFPDEHPDSSIEQLLIGHIKNSKILFDEDTSVIASRNKIASEYKMGSMSDFEMVRVEGTATKDEIDRLYCDLALIRDKKKSILLFCESRSSVLNGLVEGPYFEEVLKRISMPV